MVKERQSQRLQEKRAWRGQELIIGALKTKLAPDSISQKKLQIGSGKNDIYPEHTSARKIEG